MRVFVYQLESVVGMHFIQFQLSCEVPGTILSH